MVLGKLPGPGSPTSWMIVGQGPTALAEGAGGDCLDIFTLIYPFSPLSPSLCETARYRLKYCLIGPLNPKQPTNKPTNQPIGVAVVNEPSKFQYNRQKTWKRNHAFKYCTKPLHAIYASGLLCQNLKYAHLR